MSGLRSGLIVGCWLLVVFCILGLGVSWKGPFWLFGGLYGYLSFAIYMYFFTLADLCTPYIVCDICMMPMFMYMYWGNGDRSKGVDGCCLFFAVSLIWNLELYSKV